MQHLNVNWLKVWKECGETVLQYTLKLYSIHPSHPPCLTIFSKPPLQRVQAKPTTRLGSAEPPSRGTSARPLRPSILPTTYPCLTGNSPKLTLPPTILPHQGKITVHNLIL